MERVQVMELNNNRLLGMLRDAGTGYEVRISEVNVVKVVEAKMPDGNMDICRRCVFADLKKVCGVCPMRLACMSVYRKDRKSVVFRRIES